MGPVETPPGFNESYTIVKLIHPKTGKPFHKLAKTDRANAWTAMIADNMRQLMRTDGIAPMHVPRFNKSKKMFELVPIHDVPWMIEIVYRLITSRQDVDAPVKELLDDAIESALGIDDTWSLCQIGVKRFCQRSTTRRGAGGRLLMETPSLSFCITGYEVADKKEWNRISRQREAELSSHFGMELP